MYFLILDSLYYPFQVSFGFLGLLPVFFLDILHSRITSKKNLLLIYFCLSKSIPPTTLLAYKILSYSTPTTLTTKWEFHPLKMCVKVPIKVLMPKDTLCKHMQHLSTLLSLMWPVLVVCPVNHDYEEVTITCYCHVE